MTDQHFSRCRGCHAPVIWMQAKNGTWMICNPEKITFTPGGGPETFITPEGKAVYGKRSREGQAGYISHWATCPFRNRFGKRRKMHE